MITDTNEIRFDDQEAEKTSGVKSKKSYTRKSTGRSCTDCVEYMIVLCTLFRCPVDWKTVRLYNVLRVEPMLTVLVVELTIERHGDYYLGLP